MPLVFPFKELIHRSICTRSLLIILSLIAISTSQSILPLQTILPPATVGIPYNQTFSANHIFPNLNNFQITNVSSLPSGLRIEGWRLFGIPLRQGNATLQLALSYNGQPMSYFRKNYILVVKGITTSSILPSTYVNIPFEVNVSYVGGLPPFEWKADNPTWMTINESRISGVPDKVGNTTFLMTIVDSQNNSYSKNWTLTTEPNKLILSPLNISGQINIPAQSNFTVSNGARPYSFEFVNLPRQITSNSNTLTITLVKEGSFTVGVFVTDATGLKNYFSINISTVSTPANSQSIQGLISSVSTSYSDNKSGNKVTIFKVPPNVLIPGFSIQSNNHRPSFTYDDILPKSKILEQPETNTINTLIRTATTTNNRSPCSQSGPFIEGLGTIASIDQTGSRIFLNNWIVLVFQNCTLQAFRGQSQKFEAGNFISYLGVPADNTIRLMSITNTS